MNRATLKIWLSRDAMIALILLLCFLVSHGYRFGWDDQHLEIPLLKSLINPELYARDYYVQGLKANFTSYVYPLLSRVISTDQVPAAYLMLFLLSRYFLFFWVYKFWLHLSRNKLSAFLCALTLMVVARVQPFLYFTFSHAEFALPFVFAGLYFFFRERFLLAALTLGIGSNFHALYCFLPTAYLLFYLFFQHKRHGWGSLFKAGCLYAVSALPFIIWMIQKSIHAPADRDPTAWLPMFKEAAEEFFILGPYSLSQIFSDPLGLLNVVNVYIFLLALYIFNSVYNAQFRQCQKTQSVIITSVLLLAVYFYVGYFWPQKFLLQLSLYRAEELLLFFLPGMTTLTLLKISKEDVPWIACFAGMAMIGMSDKKLLAVSLIALLACLIGIARLWPVRPRKWIWVILCVIGAGLSLWATGYLFSLLYQLNLINIPLLVSLGAGFVLITALLYIPRVQARVSKRVLIIVPVMFCLVGYSFRHVRNLQVEEHALGKLQQAWVDMQYYVRDHTPVTALILVPHDMQMGGFRIFSERSIVVCQRDEGIVMFDVNAMFEFKERLKDIDAFKLKPDGDVQDVIKLAIEKYQVDYIVFTTFVAPPSSQLLRLEYVNAGFALYKVNEVVLEWIRRAGALRVEDNVKKD